MSRKDSPGFLLVILLMLVCLWPGFGDIFLHPNGYLFADSGDGLKNYFNFGYYLKYDTGLRFSGVNYPYGDQLLFTDTHPIFAYLLNLIDNHLIELAPNSVGIINLAILASMVAGALILYLILRHYGLPVWYSSIIAVCITLLSPQWDRIHGHLSLSYAFIIPFFWYLIIRFERCGSKILCWTALFFYTLIVGGIHIYYVAICGAFMLAYIIVHLIRNRKLNRTHAALALSVIIPLALFQFISSLTDFIPDRPIAPYGFFTYHATPASVFLPHISASTDLLNQIFKPNLSWEGRAFVGTPAIVFIVGSMVYLVQKFRNKDVSPLIQIPQSLLSFLWASIIVLLFSMCIPFEWGLQFLTELIPPLKQFRALGRFAWIFYYVINVCAAWAFFQLFKQIAKSLPSWYSLVFLTIVLGSWVFNAGSYYINHGPTSITVNDKLKNTNKDYLDRFRGSEIDFNAFQAILSCPLVAVRTDKMTFEKDLSAHNEAMVCAFQTGLPLIQSSASRPSLSQTLSSIQLFSSPYIKKVRLADMESDRPLLLIHSKGSELSDSEKRLVSAAHVLWSNDTYAYASLSLEFFSDSTETFVQQKDNSTFLSRSSKSGELRCAPNCAGIFFESFENELDAPAVFFGKGSRYSKSKELVLFDSTFMFPDSISYQASFWVYIDPTFSGMPAWEYLSGTNSLNLVSTGWQSTRDITEVDRNWVKVTFPMRPEPYHKIVLHGKKSTADNLLLKPEESDVYITLGDDLLFNNYFLEQFKED